MRAGRLDRIVTLLQPGAVTDDGFTKVNAAHASAGTRKAHFQNDRASEKFDVGGRAAVNGVTFDMRSDTLTRSVNETWRLQMGTAVYDIVGIEEIGRMDGLRFSAVKNDRFV